MRSSKTGVHTCDPDELGQGRGREGGGNRGAGGGESRPLEAPAVELQQGVKEMKGGREPKVMEEEEEDEEQNRTRTGERGDTAPTFG